MRRLLLFIPVLAVVGCARTSSLTEVNPDGSWNRMVKLVVAKQEGLGDSPTVDKIFDVPSGPEWKIVKTEKKDETEWTITRMAKLDEVISKDIAIREVGTNGESTGLMLVNEVTVKQIAQNRYKYRETYKWVGKKKEEDSKLDDIAAMKDLLPENLRTPADLEKLKNGLKPELLRIMFGPGDPMLLQLLSNPEYGIRKMVNRLAKSFDKVMADVYGDRLPMEERRKLIAKIVNEASKNIVDTQKSEKANPESAEKSGPPITMYISVKLPGKIVETDGEVDPYSGEVFWSMMPEAASLGEVSIQATCEIGN